MTKNITLLGLLIVILLSSCTKEAGFGGLANITGKVYAKDYTPAGIIEAEGYTADMKVVISVEGSGVVLDEVRTDVNGSYKFENLRKGKYQVWSFTECDKCTNNETPVIKSAEITDKKENLVLEDILINI